MNTILVIAGIAALMCAIERLWPANQLPTTKNWWGRVVLTHTAQVGVVLLAGVTWDRWAQGLAWRGLFAESPAWIQVLGTYLVSTFIYYFWHRLRHESAFFWRLCHQLHHSPRRMEVFMALYKHPVEITLNSLLTAAIVYPLCGCSVESAAVATLISAVAEFFYHWNIATPRWIGALIQRPESHRVHHQKDRHTNNYADIPLWDMLFGTWENPREPVKEVGFTAEREDQFGEMLAFRDVHQSALSAPKATGAPGAPITLLPTCLGCSKRWTCQRAKELS